MPANIGFSLTRLLERDPVPQAPVEAPDSGRPDNEPPAASGADSPDAEPSPSRPGGKPGDPLASIR